MRQCSICKEKFDIDYGGRSIDDQFFCEDCECYHTFKCAICENSELEDNRENIGTVLIVKEEDVGVPIGTYEIIKHPYYGGSVIGPGEVFPNALKRLGGLPEGEIEIETYGFPCVHLCRYCDAEIKSGSIETGHD